MMRVFHRARLGRALSMVAIAAGVLAFSQPAPAAAPAAGATLPPYQTLTPVRVLGLVRRVYRSHRPPPPYETYTLVRKQNTNYGYPDPLGSYTVHYWVRNSDRAALTRKVYRDDYDGPLVFDRPALNEATDPGPPTVDLFAQAPIKQHLNPQSYVPTPEPTGPPLKTIGSVVAIGEPDYFVTSMKVEGELLDLVLKPRRDPERNVLREIWVDKKTYELRKIISHDRLFTQDEGIFPVTFTFTLGYLDGQLLITHLHGVVEPQPENNGYARRFDEDGAVVDFDFKDITFPASLPAWYFDPRTYAQHQNDAPT
jgi:hypothetical protein